VALHTHISPGGWKIGTLVAAVQRLRLNPSIWTTATTTTTWLHVINSVSVSYNYSTGMYKDLSARISLSLFHCCACSSVSPISYLLFFWRVVPMMTAVSTSETSASIYQITRRSIPENINVHYFHNVTNVPILNAMNPTRVFHIAYNITSL
jgi:hypothetical protein